MTTRVLTQAKPAAKSVIPPGRSGMVLQRRANDRFPIAAVPPIVHEVLNSPGQPLDPATRALMEPRFGHDFSHVRVHTDARASESARAVNALAYTVGRDVVFAEGRYEPNAEQGRKLLAHELTHTIQQRSFAPGNSLHQAISIEPPGTSLEQVAKESSTRLANSPRALAPLHRIALQRQPVSAPKPPPAPQLSADDSIWVLETLRRESPQEFVKVLVANEGQIYSILNPYGFRGSWVKEQEYLDDFDAALQKWGKSHIYSQRIAKISRPVLRQKPKSREEEKYEYAQYLVRDMNRHGYTRGKVNNELESAGLMDELVNHGFEKHSRWSFKDHEEYKYEAIRALNAYVDRYDAAHGRERQTSASAPTHGEDVEFYKAWLEGLEYVASSFFGAAFAATASKFTSDPKKITAAAGMGAAVEGVVSSAGGTVEARSTMPHSAPVRREDPIAEVRQGGRGSPEPGPRESTVKTEPTKPSQPSPPPPPLKGLPLPLPPPPPSLTSSEATPMPEPVQKPLPTPGPMEPLAQTKASPPPTPARPPKSSRIGRFVRSQVLAGAMRSAEAELPMIGAGGAVREAPAQVVQSPRPAGVTPPYVSALAPSESSFVFEVPTSATPTPVSSTPPATATPAPTTAPTVMTPSLASPTAEPAVAPEAPTPAPVPAPAPTAASAPTVAAPAATLTPTGVPSPTTQVWVNTPGGVYPARGVGVYHLPGSRWYGRTAKGGYMTLADALAAGYRQAGSARTAPPSGVYSVERHGDGVEIRAWIGPSAARAGLEREMHTAAEYAIAQIAGWQRAHSTSPGLRIESGEAIRLAPEFVNQILQNQGIEDFLRALRDAAGTNYRLHLRTVTSTHPGTLRLESIHYMLGIGEGEGDDFVEVLEAVVEVLRDGRARAGVRRGNKYEFGPWFTR
jgi:hypothetical protein